MKKVIFTVLTAFILVLTVASCTNTNDADDKLFEQGIDHEEVKEDDI